MTPRCVFILLPVHNRRQITERFVRCLQEQSYRAFRLVLVDDGSTDGTAGMVLGHFPETVVLRGKGNWWWAGCLQNGYNWLKRAGAHPDDFVLIINDDTIIEPGFLSAGVRALAGKGRTLLLAALHSLQTKEFLEFGAHIDWDDFHFAATKDPAQITCFSTRGLLLKVSDLFEIGGFHPFWLPHYLSDFEFTLRARRKGFSLLVDQTVRLWLDESATGMHRLEGLSAVRFVRAIFSKRASNNPWYWSTFLFLACPSRYLLLNLWRVWRRFFVELRAAAGR